MSARGPCQPTLFRLENPLVTRLGPDFPGRVPAVPGVYFFRDDGLKLLYIGQSGNLRRRLGSYRHVSPERNPRRTLRLVHRTARIDWRVCATAEEAVALEAALLREYRPPFNRAGTWEGPPWWFHARAEGTKLCFGVRREPEPEGGDEIGPLPSSFRRVFVSLARCVAREVYPERGLAEYPAGLFSVPGPLEWAWEMEHAEAWAEEMRALARREKCELAARVAAWPRARTEAEEEFWTAERERLERYVRHACSVAA